MIREAICIGVFSLLFVSLGNAASLTRGGIEYGPEKEMSGVYFTNFENSKFVECGGPADCDNWVKKEAEWVNCVPLACQDLQSRVQKLNESLSKWGDFNIVFVGCRSLHRRVKEFIGDTESKVLVERILRLEKRTTP